MKPVYASRVIEATVNELRRRGVSQSIIDKSLKYLGDTGQPGNATLMMSQCLALHLDPDLDITPTTPKVAPVDRKEWAQPAVNVPGDPQPSGGPRERID
jgi:hypothetical protein